MKYNINHIPDFVGATGKCENCGIKIELDAGDILSKYECKYKEGLDEIWSWKISCPICAGNIRCKKRMNTSSEK
jgi:hypothetical protein